MTPKEKEKQLMGMYLNILNGIGIVGSPATKTAKRCALIAIKEMQEVYSNVASAVLKENKDGNYKSKFLTEVEQEIEKP